MCLHLHYHAIVLVTVLRGSLHHNCIAYIQKILRRHLLVDPCTINIQQTIDHSKTKLVQNIKQCDMKCYSTLYDFSILLGSHT